MPYCKLETNVDIYYEKADEVLIGLSGIVSRVTGKPETIVQTALREGMRMYMGGNDEPTAHVEVKGIAFSESLAKPMSAELCAFIGEKLGIDPRRIFITFDSYSASMWGCNGGTF